MSNRVAIPRTVRFDVFKRDKFACQYCGAKAPDVLLEADHIHPVADGGTNDILNLVTACRACNGGKGAKLLSENATLEKQRAQLEELQNRREQIEMLIAWRDDLDRMSVDEIQIVSDRISRQSLGTVYPTEEGRDNLRRLLKRYGLEEVLKAIDDVFHIYLKFSGDQIVEDSADRAFRKIGWMLWTNRQSVDKPYLKRLLYIQGICRNRFQWVERPPKYLPTLELIHLQGEMPVEQIEELALTSSSMPELLGKAHAWYRARNPGEDGIPL